MSKGFTLIELLVVIAVLGILAIGLISVIDPTDKINAAKDAKVQQDVKSLANALESYAVSHNGQYITNVSHDAAQAVLVASGELKTILTPPSGYTTCAGGVYNSQYYVNWDGTKMYADCTLKSKKYTSRFAVPHFIWCSSSGKADVTGGPCP